MDWTGWCHTAVHSYTTASRLRRLAVLSLRLRFDLAVRYTTPEITSTHEAAAATLYRTIRCLCSLPSVAGASLSV